MYFIFDELIKTKNIMETIETTDVEYNSDSESFVDLSVKVSYDLSSLAHFIHEGQTGYRLDEINDVAGSVSSIQLTYSTLYICYLELIAEGKLKGNDIPKHHNDLFMFIGNQLTFLNNLETALLDVRELQCEEEELKELASEAHA